MWEVMSFGERPYWDMSNQDVSVPWSHQAFLNVLSLGIWGREWGPQRAHHCWVLEAQNRVVSVSKTFIQHIWSQKDTEEEGRVGKLLI